MNIIAEKAFDTFFFVVMIVVHVYLDADPLD
jgi:hypothetical protein